MRCEIFDDRYSYLHFFLGCVASILFIVIALVFFAYQVISYIVKKDSVECFVGDLCEFALGFYLTNLIFELLRISLI